MSLALNNISRLRNIFVVTMLVLALLASTMRPSYAATSGQTSTRNIILGALAMTAGIILYNNYQHKYAAAHTVVGYTRDGGTVYADGRIVYPDGTTLYTSNNGNSVCTFDGYGQQCQPGNVYGYYPNNGSYPFSNPANPYGYYPNQTQTNCSNDPDDCQYATYPNGYSPNGYNPYSVRTTQYPSGYYRANARNHGRHLGWYKHQNQDNQGHGDDNRGGGD